MLAGTQYTHATHRNTPHTQTHTLTTARQTDRHTLVCRLAKIWGVEGGVVYN